MNSLAQIGLTVSLNEAIHIVEGIKKNTIHQDYVHLCGKQCTTTQILFRSLFMADLITSIQERSFYGRNTDLTVGGGILLVKTTKSVLLVTYPPPVGVLLALISSLRYSEPVQPQEIVPMIEKFADTLPQ